MTVNTQARVHRSKMGTFHAEPYRCWVWDCRSTAKHEHRDRFKMVTTAHDPVKAPVAWTINDTRGTIDGGASCDECGACECCDCRYDHKAECTVHDENAGECVGLSFAFVCLDGGESLCEACAGKAGIEVIECDCK